MKTTKVTFDQLKPSHNFKAIAIRTTYENGVLGIAYNKVLRCNACNKFMKNNPNDKICYHCGAPKYV